jgi:hypothetical protein
MPRKLTLQEFINRANLIHNFKYDYSKFVLKNFKTKGTFICYELDKFGNIHGEFDQRPDQHLSGAGCKKCGVNKMTLYKRKFGKQNRKSNKESFIEKAILIHGFNRYDYSKVKYGKNGLAEVIIICLRKDKFGNIHGDFSQAPQYHLQGRGCKKCFEIDNSLNKIKSTGEFIKEATIIHNNKYNYSKVKYNGVINDVIIICPELDEFGNIHGEFSQTPSNHLKGEGCPPCGYSKMANSHRSNTEEFIEQAQLIHKNKYFYLKTKYGKNNSEHVIITCLKEDDEYGIHGDFLQTPAQHLQGHGCDKCAKTHPITLDIFIRRCNLIHNFKYNYSQVDFLDINKKEKIICPKHGEFFQTLRTHMYGYGCKYCKNKNQGIVYDFLKNNNINFISEFEITLPINKKGYTSKIDFYIPMLNLCIEYNGRQHYECVNYSNDKNKNKKNFKRQRLRDKQLRKYCEQNNINLLEIDGRIYQNKKLKKYLYNYFVIIINILNMCKE